MFPASSATDSFEAVLERIEGCGGDQDRFTLFDMEFHVQLARCSRNPLMLKVYQHVNAVRANAQWNRVKRVILTPEKIAAYTVQHRETQKITDPNSGMSVMTKAITAISAGNGSPISRWSTKTVAAFRDDRITDPMRALPTEEVRSDMRRL